MAVGINWTLIGRATGFYSSKGFTLLEMPWAVDRDVAAVTCLDRGRMFPFEDRVLVGSAEQSFMEAQFNQELQPGRYVACTPCFRNEPVVDQLHQKWFMKVELFSNEPQQQGLALEFAKLAQKFVRDFTWHPEHGYLEAEIVATEEGYDLEVAGIEVGSYSTRTYGGHTWTCGTGLAEPRLSIARSTFYQRQKLVP